MKSSNTSTCDIGELLDFQVDILNNIKDCIIVSNLDGKIVYWNNGAEKLYGYSDKEVLGRSISILYHDNSNFKRDFERLVKSTNDSNEIKGIFKGRKKDGSTVFSDFSRIILRDKNENITGFLSVSRDVTKQKAAQEALKKANSYNRGLIEASLDPLVTIGHDGKITDVNSATEIITGYSRDDLIGTDFSCYFTAPEKAREGYQRVFNEGFVKDYELEIKHEKGFTTPVSYNASVYRDENGEVIGIFAAARDISELKVAENALKVAHDNLEIKVKERTKELEEAYNALSESKAKLRIAMDMAKIVSWEYDVKNDVFTFDNHFYALYGTTAEEQGGTKMSSGEYSSKFIPPEESPLVTEEINRALETNDPDFVDTMEHSIIRSDGEKRYIIVRFGVIKDDNGITVKTYGANQDITELKQSEKDLINSNERFKKILDGLNALVYVADMDTHEILFLNSHARKLWGDVEGQKCWKSIQTGQTGPCSFCTNDKLLDENGNPTGVFVWEIQNTITKRWYQCHDSAIQWIDGQLVRIEIATDITERKELENRFLERSRRLNILNKIILAANRSKNIEFLLKDILNLILNLMYFDGGAIYIINEDTRIAEIKHFEGLSDDFKEIISIIQIDEYPFNEVLVNGKPMFISKHDLDFPEFIKWNLKSYASIPIYSKNKVIGAFNIANKKSHYFTDEEKQLMEAIGREIGNSISKLLAEEEMKNLIKELKRSNEELEQFAYITSHDLQEPLRTIASFTQLLQIRYNDKLDSDADEFMGYMVDASIRMKDMIQGLLNYAQVGKEGTELKAVNLEDIVNEALSNLRLVIEENDAVIIYDELPSVTGDSKLLVQLFQNLISNAIKFKDNKPPEIHISASKSEKENKYVISVEDNGIGIDPQYAERIFKVFKRLHTLDEYKGAGIGLAISKRIIEYHDGSIWVESELNKGSKFYFTLNPVK